MSSTAVHCPYRIMEAKKRDIKLAGMLSYLKFGTVYKNFRQRCGNLEVLDIQASLFSGRRGMEAKLPLVEE